MVFSKIYYSSFAGQKVKAEQSSFLCVNPEARPSSALFVGSCAERAAIGGQVAARLALQHFVSGAQESIVAAREAKIADNNRLSLQALEDAFKVSNSAVYEFGHKLSAGGRMAASLTSIFLRDGLICAGRVGKGVAYLIRDAEAFPFFAERPKDFEYPALGSNSIVAVELASVEVEAGDTILVFSDPLQEIDNQELGQVVRLLLPRFDKLIDYDSPKKEVFDNSLCERLAAQLPSDKKPAFSAIIGVGPQLNFLSSKMAA